MVRRVAAAFFAVMLLTAGSIVLAEELSWVQNTPAQTALKEYIENVNRYLTDQGETGINTIFEMYSAFAVLGITALPNAETPEDVEITVTLTYDGISSLQLRTSDIRRFPVIAASLIRALYGDSMSAEEAIAIPADRAASVLKAPDNSYEEKVDDLNGTVPRFYYAYYPNQYHDGISWMQMTIIFPMPGTWDGGGMITGTVEEKGQDPDSGASEDYEGYYSEDDYSHYEVFSSPTPEPDSAAAEYDFR